MKVCYLTAGAAGMFCGSCMHDNALAKAMISQGVDCILVPVYTPIRTDEVDVSIDRVFFGGINVYLQQKMPWMGYLPRWVDSVLSRPGLIRFLTKRSQSTDPKFLGALTVSMLRGMEGKQRKEVVRLVDWLARDIRPDVLILTNFLIGGCIPEIRKRIDCSVVVTLQGDDIFYEFLPQPFRDQTIAALQKLVPQVDRFIVHSQRYADKLAGELRIPDSKIAITPLGIDLSDMPATSRASKANSRSIGYLARLAPEKGLHRIVDAFIALCRMQPQSRHRLDIAGWLGANNEAYWNELHAKLKQALPEDRFRYWGSVDHQQKKAFLQSIDVLCVPVGFEEPKGLYVLEAAATGVAYLQPDRGAFVETHQRIDAGRIFASEKCDSPELLAAELTSILEGIDDQHAQIQRRLSEIRNEIDISTMSRRTVELLRSLV